MGVEKSENQVSAYLGMSMVKKLVCTSELQQVSGSGDTSLGMWKHANNEGGDLELKMA